MRFKKGIVRVEEQPGNLNTRNFCFYYEFYGQLWVVYGNYDFMDTTIEQRLEQSSRQSA